MHMFQVTIPYYTGLPEDVVTNTWHAQFNSPTSPLTSDFANMADNLRVFYEQTYTTPGSMAKYARPALTSLKVYDMDDPKPRAPRYSVPMPISVTSDPTNSNLPSEVAVCLSYRATYQSGVPQASQRGRVFLGAIGSAFLDPGLASTFPKITVANQQNVGNRGNQFLQACLTDGWTWVVSSRKRDEMFVVTGGWVDDAFDTQRRRGQKPAVRDLWP